MIPSPLSAAKADPRLRGAALAVYIDCLEHLDAFKFRKVKVLAVASRCHLKDWTASRAMRVLTEAGYLAVRQRKARNQAGYYRLVFSGPTNER